MKHRPYLANGRVAGVVTWGIFGRIPEARALPIERGPLQASDLRGRLTARAYRDPRRRNVFEGTDMAAPSPERAAASPVNGA
jgi:hypothetical protein